MDTRLTDRYQLKTIFSIWTAIKIKRTFKKKKITINYSKTRLNTELKIQNKSLVVRKSVDQYQTHNNRFSTSICTELQMQTNQVQMQSTKHTHKSTMCFGTAAIVTMWRRGNSTTQHTEVELNTERKRRSSEAKAEPPYSIDDITGALCVVG